MTSDAGLEHFLADAENHGASELEIALREAVELRDEDAHLQALLDDAIRLDH